MACSCCSVIVWLIYLLLRHGSHCLNDLGSWCIPHHAILCKIWLSSRFSILISLILNHELNLFCCRRIDWFRLHLMHIFTRFFDKALARDPCICGLVSKQAPCRSQLTVPDILVSLVRVGHQTRWHNSGDLLLLKHIAARDSHRWVVLLFDLDLTSTAAHLFRTVDEIRIPVDFGRSHVFLHDTAQHDDWAWLVWSPFVQHCVLHQFSALWQAAL